MFFDALYVSPHEEPLELEYQLAITAFTPFMNSVSQGQEIFKR